MKGLVFYVVGVCLIVPGVIVWDALGSGQVPIEITNLDIDPATAQTYMRYGVSGVLCGLGAIFLLLGLKTSAGAKRQKKRNLRIMAAGIETQGSVTYVDRNFRILVNQTPIYSIVEYTYQDGNGTTHTRRIDTVPSEIVIRRQIQVGGTIPVKYLPESPSESVMLLA